MTESRIYTPHFQALEAGKSLPEALRDVTDLVVVAHPDDAEILAPDRIALCRQDPTRKLGVVVLTDGQGAPRKGRYAHFTNADLAHERKHEQLRAAEAGKYSAVIMLGHPDLKSEPIDRSRATSDIFGVLIQCPNLHGVVTHNPFDKHPAHLSTMSATIGALRMLPPEAQARITEVRGGEVWGEVSWVGARWLRKIPLSAEQMRQQLDLLGMHASQTEGSFEYVRSVRDRESARKLFEGLDGVQDRPAECAGLMLAVDLSSLIGPKAITLRRFVEEVTREHAKLHVHKAAAYEPTLSTHNRSLYRHAFAATRDVMLAVLRLRAAR